MPKAGAAEAVPEPGTPEYEKAYDKAFNEAPGAADGAPSGTPDNGDGQPPTDQPAGDQPPPTGDAPAPTPASEPAPPTSERPPDGGGPTLADALEQNRHLNQQLNSALKALKDTQGWGRNMAQRMREVQKALDEQKRGERPKILDDFSDLETAIEYVLKGNKPDGQPADDGLEPPAFDFGDGNAQPGAQPAPASNPAKQWTETVMAGCPEDLGDLLAIPEFGAQVKARKDALGPQWSNPLVAIREFNTLRANWLRQEAEKTADQRARARGKMNLPAGGSGNNPAPTPGNDQAAYDAVMNESPEKFNQRKAQTLGF